MKNLIRLFLWPILWWGFSRAMYCAETPGLETTVQLAPPVPLKLDLSHVSEADIEDTVLHMQRFNHDSEQRVASLEVNLATEHTALLAAKVQTAALQTIVDTRTRERDEARAEVTTLTRQWWHLFWVVFGEGAVILGLLVFIFRKPLLALAGL